MEPASLDRCRRPLIIVLISSLAVYSLLTFQPYYYDILPSHLWNNNYKRFRQENGFDKFQLENGFTDQEHPSLLKHIRRNWIHGPSNGSIHLANPTKTHRDYSEEGQSRLVDELLHEKKNGFFVECGALDGEFNSNSLFFELNRNWTGILIEPDPISYTKLSRKNRKVYSINACLNTRNVSEVQSFRAKAGHGRLDGHSLTKVPGSSRISVQCFTLFSIMKALGQNRIDFFSLDVEGVELDILKTIPFSKLFVEVIMVEYVAHPVQRGSSEAKHVRDRIQRFMDANGYTLIKDTNLDLLYRNRVIKY